jgi:CheY-like chemotaxis protein
MHAEDYIHLLNHSLAELADRLRHSSGPSRAGSSLPPCVPRLEAVARLLSSASLRPDLGPLASLGSELKTFLGVLRDCPGCDLAWLAPALGLLADTLEGTLDRIDRGVPLAEVAADPEWLLVLSWLESAGSPLEIMDELDACAKRWEARWCDGDLPEDQEQELQRRWQTFRRYGDAMFGRLEPGQETRVTEARTAHQVVLLVESVLRREHLLQKLRERGLGVKVAATAAEAATLAQGPPAVKAVLCDDLEPSRNLARLVSRRAEQPGFPALVLVTGGSGNSAADLQRARSHGADGVWIEPFGNDPLDGLPPAFR